MIRTLHRVRGASALGATGPGQTGPFGEWPDEDDGQDDEQHDIKLTRSTRSAD